MTRRKAAIPGQKQIVKRKIEQTDSIGSKQNKSDEQVIVQAKYSKSTTDNGPADSKSDFVVTETVLTAASCAANFMTTMYHYWRCGHHCHGH